LEINGITVGAILFLAIGIDHCEDGMIVKKNIGNKSNDIFIASGDAQCCENVAPSGL
jgi:hypothetical protein